MRVLVTGATGRIGANVAKRLVQRGDEVRCQVRPDSDRKAKLAQIGDVEVVEVDLADRERLSRTVDGMDAIVHLGVKLRGPSNFEHLDVNVAPTLTLLDAARTRNPNLRRFVYGSSDALYPHSGWMPELIREHDKFTRPVGMYAVSKVASESIVQSYHRQYGIPTVTLNIPWTFCGKELLGHRSKEISPRISDQVEHLGTLPKGPRIERCLRDLRAARADGAEWVVPLNPQGPPFMRHIGDVRDVVRSVEAALSTERGVGGSYVIMSDALAFGIGVPHLAKVSGKPCVEILWPHSMYYWYDTSASRDLLGYTPQYDSATMLEDAWRHENGQDIGVVDVGPNHPLGGDRTL